MIKITIRRQSRSILVPQGICDEYRKLDKDITLFGIKIWSMNSVHNASYFQADLKPKPIGFIKTLEDEKTKEK